METPMSDVVGSVAAVLAAETEAEAVFLALGAASACWENLADAGVFQSEEAQQVGRALCVRLGIDAGSEYGPPLVGVPEEAPDGLVRLDWFIADGRLLYTVLVSPSAFFSPPAYVQRAERAVATFPDGSTVERDVASIRPGDLAWYLGEQG